MRGDKNGIIVAVSIAAMLLLGSCTQRTESGGDALFERVLTSTSNIEFRNDVTPDQQHNISLDNNFYSGGGAAIGDVNNDGLPDLYLVANQKPNRLYLNRGNFVFEDITDRAGVAGSKPWSTGVSMVDVNGDGQLDIYVANSGFYSGNDRKNELFVNNGEPSGDGQIPTFSERAAEFGIADSGYSMHSVFFDYDRDGDLDMYLVNNHASKPIGAYNLAQVDREESNFETGDRLYRFEGDSFTEVTQEVGIYSSPISFGYGATVGDLNRDGWPDIYVSNDFFERDYLYFNRGNGTFEEVLTDKLSSTSTTSMSGDVADLNNDGFPEIYITDMLPGSEQRVKTITDFIGWDEYQEEIELGFHRKFTRNTLHYNNGNGTFSEIGRYAGVEATDWSWGALMADFNLDGMRDIFVANGIYKDVTGKDHMLAAVQGKLQRQVVRNGRVDFVKLTEIMPTTPVPNYMFENDDSLRFIDRSADWGLGQPGFSHGAAYGDIDRDGDLDLVVNNVNMDAFLYRNNAAEREPERSWLELELAGEEPNTMGVGAQVEMEAGGRTWYAEQMLQRGFLSSVDPRLHVGLGRGVPVIDTLKVYWPDGRVSIRAGVKSRQRVVIRQSDALETSGQEFDAGVSTGSVPILEEVVAGELNLEWRHLESTYNDFSESPLLLHMRSTEGPPVCSGDVNGDGHADIYVGGAAGQPGALFFGESSKRFRETDQPVLESDRGSEDTDCLFFEADGDGVPELYVASGSSEFPAGSKRLADRLYRLQGGERLVRMEESLPRPVDGFAPTAVVKEADIDGDGDLDLFTGTRVSPMGYGIAVGGHLLANDGSGRFRDVTERVAPELRPGELKSAGITDAAWGDMDGNGSPDLVLAGEWMPLTIFYNERGAFRRANPATAGLQDTYGWWLSLALADLNGDGTIDLVGGNHGLNSRFDAAPGRPVEMWVGDMDGNGTMEHIYSTYTDGKGPYPVALRHNLLNRLPYLGRRYSSYADYAGETIPEIFRDEQLERADHFKAEQLASVIVWNRGDGSYRIETLPPKVQWAPIFSILVEDLEDDGIPELLMGGNLDAVQPQAGPYDASYGVYLQQDSTGTYREVPPGRSGFFVPGEVRDFQVISRDGHTLILVARNNRGLKIFAGRPR